MKYQCANCGHIATRGDCPDVKAAALTQRMDPGDTFTDKECPKCGALAYPIEFRWGDDAFETKQAAQEGIAQMIFEDLHNTYAAGVQYGKTNYAIHVTVRLIRNP